MSDLNSLLKQIVQIRAQSGVGQSRPVDLLPKSFPEKATSPLFVATNVVTGNTTTSAIAGGSNPRSLPASAIVTTVSNAPVVVGRSSTSRTATLHQNSPKSTVQDVDHRVVIKVFKSINKRDFRSYILRLEPVDRFLLKSSIKISEGRDFGTTW